MSMSCSSRVGGAAYWRQVVMSWDVAIDRKIVVVRGVLVRCMNSRSLTTCSKKCEQQWDDEKCENRIIPPKSQGLDSRQQESNTGKCLYSCIWVNTLTFQYINVSNNQMIWYSLQMIISFIPSVWITSALITLVITLWLLIKLYLIPS